MRAHLAIRARTCLAISTLVVVGTVLVPPASASPDTAHPTYGARVVDLDWPDQDSTVNGSATVTATPNHQDPWPTGVRVTGAVPGVSHSFDVGYRLNGQPVLLQVCSFTPSSDGAGSCDGSVLLPRGALLTTAVVGQFDPVSGGYRTVGFGTLFAITDLMRFVQNDYLDVLGRPVDKPGLVFWVPRFYASDGFVNRGKLTAILLDTQEWRDHIVSDLFSTFLRRPVDPLGLGYWSSQLQAGARIEDLEAGIVGSDEYKAGQGGGTDSGFVAAAYEDLLLRAVDPAGLAYWTAQLKAGTSRRDVAGALVGSDEGLRVVVEEQYEHYLARPADDGAVTYWANQLAGGATDQDLIIALTASDEYFAKV